MSPLGDRLLAAEHELDRLVAQGVSAGGVLAVHHRGAEHVRCAGRLRDDGAPVTDTTPFWVASVSKPVGAVLAHSLVADGTLDLDAPVDRWLPELAAPRVLVEASGPLDRTEPARRVPTVREVLAGTAGVGLSADMFAGAATAPLLIAMAERGVGPGPFANDLDPDTWIARLAELPLASQPGTAWRYHTGHDVLSVLVARAAGRPLAELLTERVLEPVGARRTGFGDPRLTTHDVAEIRTTDSYGKREVIPAPDPGTPPALASLANGLLSTASDLLRIGVALLEDDGPLLSRSSRETMRQEALTAQQRVDGLPFLEPGASWGLGVGVDVETGDDDLPPSPWHRPGRFGWMGATGTTFHVDPNRGTVVVLLTGRMMSGPEDAPAAILRAVAEAV